MFRFYSQKNTHIWKLHLCLPPSLCLLNKVCPSAPADQVRNSYYIGADGSLRLLLANGMEVALQTEPHLLAGTVNPTVGKRNVTLPIDNGLNLVEWRQRKEQARGQVTVFGRRLRVSRTPSRSLPLEAESWGEGMGRNPDQWVLFLKLSLGEKVFLGPPFPHPQKGESKAGNSCNKSLVHLFSWHLWQDHQLWC